VVHTVKAAVVVLDAAVPWPACSPTATDNDQRRDLNMTFNNVYQFAGGDIFNAGHGNIVGPFDGGTAVLPLVVWSPDPIRS
jgi:hypothetical protein